MTTTPPPEDATEPRHRVTPPPADGRCARGGPRTAACYYEDACGCSSAARLAEGRDLRPGGDDARVVAAEAEGPWCRCGHPATRHAPSTHLPAPVVPDSTDLRAEVVAALHHVHWQTAPTAVTLTPGACILCAQQATAVLAVVRPDGVSAEQIDTAEALDDYLYGLNDQGSEPFVLVVDARGNAAAAWVAEVGGDDVCTGVTIGDPNLSTVAGLDRDQATSWLTYPVRIIYREPDSPAGGAS